MLNQIIHAAKVLQKRRPEMDTHGFHGDTFSGGFGDFHPAKKRNPSINRFTGADNQEHPFFAKHNKLKVRLVTYLEMLYILFFSSSPKEENGNGYQWVLW